MASKMALGVWTILVSSPWSSLVGQWGQIMAANIKRFGRPVMSPFPKNGHGLPSQKGV